MIISFFKNINLKFLLLYTLVFTLITIILLMSRDILSPIEETVPNITLLEDTSNNDSLPESNKLVSNSSLKTDLSTIFITVICVPTIIAISYAHPPVYCIISALGVLRIFFD